MTKPPIALRADEVETLSGACPSLFRGVDAATGEAVELHYAGWTLRVTRGGAEAFAGDVPGARGAEWCALEDACAAAGVTLLADGEAAPTTLRRDDVVETCPACPTSFRGVDLGTGDEVEMRYRGGCLIVMRGFATAYSGPVPDARGDGVCTLDEACAAAGIVLVG